MAITPPSKLIERSAVFRLSEPPALQFAPEFDVV